MIDGAATDAGLDLFALPTHRFANWLHFKALEWVEWDEEGEKRQQLESALEWPEIAAVDDLERSDRQARQALAALGITLPEAGFVGMRSA